MFKKPKKEKDDHEKDHDQIRDFIKKVSELNEEIFKLHDEVAKQKEKILYLDNENLKAWSYIDILEEYHDKLELQNERLRTAMKLIRDAHLMEGDNEASDATKLAFFSKLCRETLEGNHPLTGGKAPAGLEEPEDQDRSCSHGNRYDECEKCMEHADKS